MKLQLKFFLLICIYIFSVVWGYAGSISGRVTDINGNPLNNIYINAYIKNEQGYSLIRLTSTDWSGYYKLTDLHVYGDSYYIAFTNRYGPYVSVWHDKPIFLNEGDVVDGINAKMELGGGRITGRIENLRGQPFKQAGVAAYSWDGNNMLYVKSGHYDPNTGEYIMHGLASGDYYLFFGDGSDTYIGEGYPDEVPSNYSSPGNKTAVTVVAGQTTSGINAQLGDKGRIFGRVTDEDGNPLENIYVQAYNHVPYELGSSVRLAKYVYTGKNGYYLFEGLSEDFYYLVFYDKSHTYVSEAYHNEAPIVFGRLGEKSAVKVSFGEVSQADAELEIGGEITGIVTDHNGNPLNNTNVTVFTWNGIEFDNQYNSVGADDSGIYRISGLASGDYYLRFSSYDDKYVTMGYPNEIGFDGNSIGDKTAVSVLSGQITENIDVQISTTKLTGTIAGRITDAQGNNISSATVMVDVLVWEDNSFRRVNRIWAKDDGSYAISGLPAGEYYLRFLTDSFAYHSELYKDIPFSEDNRQGTEPIIVSAGEVINGIDAQLSRTGTIEGQVINQDGERITSDIKITVYEWNGQRLIPVRYSFTGNDGVYSIKGFENKDYYLVFEDSEYRYLTTAYPSQNFIDLNRIDDKVAVTARSGQVVSGIDIQMNRAPVIRGRVSDLSGLGIGEITVIAYAREGGRFVEKHRVTTQSDGSYTLDGLALGKYYLKFVDENEIFASQGYPKEEPFNAIEIGSKTAVELVALDDIENINVQLNQRGNLSGTVTDIQGKALEGIQVNTCVWQAEQFQCDNPTITDQAGNYFIENIESGNYFIKFSDTQESQYLDAGYPMESPFDWLSSDGKSLVAVQSGQITTGVNMQLEKAASISGTVTELSDTEIADIRVRACVWEEDDFRCLKSTRTDENGDYSLKGLGSGQYYIVFDSRFYDYFREVNINNLVTKAYGETLPFNWQTPSDTAVVNLVSGDEVRDIDVQMINGGYITGKVTDNGLYAIKDLSISACVWNLENFDCSEAISTDKYGDYRLGPLKPGSYYIRVTDTSGLYYETGYPNEMPFQSTQIGTKQIVTVNSDEVTSANNLQLELAPNLVIAGISDHLVTSEDGDSIELDIALATEPSGTVGLELTSDNSLEGNVFPAELTFTSANWNIPQRVQIAGVDDSKSDGEQLFNISLEAHSGHDNSYNNLAIQQLSIINRDNELINYALFIEQHEVETDSLVASNIINPDNIVGNSRIKIEGGEYSINQGDWTNKEGSIGSDDRVMVRHQSASDYGTIQETVLTIGDTVYVFTSITKTH